MPEFLYALWGCMKTFALFQAIWVHPLIFLIILLTPYGFIFRHCIKYHCVEIGVIRFSCTCVSTALFSSMRLFEIAPYQTVIDLSDLNYHRNWITTESQKNHYWIALIIVFKEFFWNLKINIIGVKNFVHFWEVLDPSLLNSNLLYFLRYFLDEKKTSESKKKKNH